MARFNVPPGWERPPEGYIPDTSWRPQPDWPPAPDGWSFWVDDAGNPTSAPPDSWTPQGAEAGHAVGSAEATPAPDAGAVRSAAAASTALPWDAPAAANADDDDRTVIADRAWVTPEAESKTDDPWSAASATSPVRQDSAYDPWTDSASAPAPVGAPASATAVLPQGYPAQSAGSAAPASAASATPAPGASAAPAPAAARTRRPSRKLLAIIAGALVLLLLIIGAIVFAVSQSEPTFTASDVARSYNGLTVAGLPVTDVNTTSGDQGGSAATACFTGVTAMMRSADFTSYGSLSNDDAVYTMHYSGNASNYFDTYLKSADGCADSQGSFKLAEHSGAFEHPRYARLTHTDSSGKADGAYTVVQWGNTITLAAGSGDGIYGKVLARDVKHGITHR